MRIILRIFAVGCVALITLVIIWGSLKILDARYKTPKSSESRFVFTENYAIALVLDRLDRTTWGAQGYTCAQFHLAFSEKPFAASRSVEPGAWLVTHTIKPPDPPWHYTWKVYESGIVAPIEKSKEAWC